MPTLQAVCVSCVVQHWSELAAAAALAQDSDDHHDGVECAAQYARQALAALPIEVAELVLKRLSPAALALTEHVIAQVRGYRRRFTDLADELDCDHLPQRSRV